MLATTQPAPHPDEVKGRIGSKPGNVQSEGHPEEADEANGETDDNEEQEVDVVALNVNDRTF